MSQEEENTQRRDAFRVRPSSRTPQLRIAGLPALAITDLSLGGLSIQLDGPAPWAEGEELDAQLDLSRDARFPARLRVQRIERQGDAHRIGFSWARIEPAAERQLQLYIDQAQRINRLLQRKEQA